MVVSGNTFPVSQNIKFSELEYDIQQHLLLL